MPMSTDRIFCRFNRDPGTASFSVTEIPKPGLCLSAFVILTSTRRLCAVLMGRMNPEARWDHLGALDPGRVGVHSRGWMLPSSHLIYEESPQVAARRILSEQLGLDQLEVEGPQVVSEVGTPRRFPGLGGHWDLEFLFRGTLDETAVPTHPAWSRLEFVDTRTTAAAEFARSHEEVLASAGLPVGPSSPAA